MGISKYNTKIVLSNTNDNIPNLCYKNIPKKKKNILKTKDDK